MVKRLAILGSTGSIGRQTLEVVRAFPERFSITALAAATNLELLAEQAREFQPAYLGIAQPEDYPKLQELLGKNNLKLRAGTEGLSELATGDEVDQVLTAVVGTVGIKPTLAAIRAGKAIALANKETLVTAGSVIIPAARQHRVTILPVDSEPSAIFQCLEGRDRKQVSRLILTASGGPFRQLPPEALEQVTLAQALNHPNWKMGAKISIDSATMFNKGLELIEAHWLFEMELERIAVLLHPESVVHSLVELVDGSLLAQLGCCDMRLPIQYALTYPERLNYNFPPLDLSRGLQLNFAPVDQRLFPALELAYHAGRAGGSMPAALNAANEQAVQAFQAGAIKFVAIVPLVAQVLERHQKEAFATTPDLEQILAVDQWARHQAASLIKQGR